MYMKKRAAKIYYNLLRSIYIFESSNTVDLFVNTFALTIAFKQLHSCIYKKNKLCIFCFSFWSH